MTLTIPIERLGNVTLDERDAVVDIAIGLYKREAVSLERAAKVAGISSVEMLAELRRRHIPINYGVEELSEDVTTLEKILVEAVQGPHAEWTPQDLEDIARRVRGKRSGDDLSLSRGHGK